MVTNIFGDPVEPGHCPDHPQVDVRHEQCPLCDGEHQKEVERNHEMNRRLHNFQFDTA